MSDEREIIRPILFMIRFMQWVAAVVVMGLTAWAVVHLKGYRVVYTLVIAVLTVAFYIPALFLACMKRNRGYMLPVDIIFYALWLAAFIFLAQTNNNDGCRWFVWGNSRACSNKNAAEAFTFLAFFWTLCGMGLEIMNFYYSREETGGADLQRHSEKQPPPQSSSVPVSQATNGDQTAV